MKLLKVRKFFQRCYRVTKRFSIVKWTNEKEKDMCFERKVGLVNFIYWTTGSGLFEDTVLTQKTV